MSESPVSITMLNDFIFCPVSIYFHNLDYNTDKTIYQEAAQINGSAAHTACDKGRYSTKKTILQGTEVYCEKYDVFGKIDVFDFEKGCLVERKKKISRIYDGYIFQVYAQYFSLVEMGYSITEMYLHSMDDNKRYLINLPSENPKMLEKFEKTLNKLRTFTLDDFKQDNELKCYNCIYEPLCSFAVVRKIKNDNSS